MVFLCLSTNFKYLKATIFIGFFSFFSWITNKKLLFAEGICVRCFFFECLICWFSQYRVDPDTARHVPSTNSNILRFARAEHEIRLARLFTKWFDRRGKSSPVTMDFLDQTSRDLLKVLNARKFHWNRGLSIKFLVSKSFAFDQLKHKTTHCFGSSHAFNEFNFALHPFEKLSFLSVFFARLFVHPINSWLGCLSGHFQCHCVLRSPQVSNRTEKYIFLSPHNGRLRRVYFIIFNRRCFELFSFFLGHYQAMQTLTRRIQVLNLTRFHCRTAESAWDKMGKVAW